MSYVHDFLGTTGWKITLYNLNPLVRFVEAYRDVLYDMRFPPLYDVAFLIGVAIASLLAGMAVFGRLEGDVAEEL
jgi:ABC-type polysaccharide/polyol phosphate export permease